MTSQFCVHTSPCTKFRSVIKTGSPGKYSNTILRSCADHAGLFRQAGQLVLLERDSGSRISEPAIPVAIFAAVFVFNLLIAICLTDIILCASMLLQDTIGADTAGSHRYLIRR